MMIYIQLLSKLFKHVLLIVLCLIGRQERNHTMPGLLPTKPFEECTYQELLNAKARLEALLEQVEDEIQTRLED